MLKYPNISSWSFQILLVLPIILILCFDPAALDPVLNPRLLCLSLALIPAFIFGLSQDRFRAALGSTPSILILLFLLIETLSWLWNAYRLEGLVILLKDLTFYFLFLLVTSMDWTSERLYKLGASSVLCLLLILGFVLLEDFLPNWQGAFSDFAFTSLSGRMAHHNLLASAILILLPLSFIQRRLWQRILVALLVALAIGLVLFTRSRSALLALIISGSFFLLSFLLRAHIPRLRFTWRRLGLIGVILLTPLLLVNYSIVLTNTGDGKSLQSRHMDLSSTEKNFTTGERLKIWDYTLAMIQEHGFLGLGPGNWKTEFPSYGSEVYRTRQGMVQFQRPHNDYLWIWAETGPLGLVFFLLFIGLTLGQVLKNIRQNKQACESLLGAVFVSILVVSLFSFPRERIFHQFFFFLSAGIIHSRFNVRSSQGFSDAQAFVIGLLSFSLLGLMSLASFQRWQGERISRKILVAHSESNWEALLSFKAQTDELSFYPLSPVGMPMEFYSGLAYLNLGDKASALAEYKKGYQLHPNNLQICNNLANTYTLMNQTDSALVYYHRATIVSPFYKEGILNLASTYFNISRLKEAYTVLREKAAVFDDDRHLYEQYVLVILKAWCAEEGIDLSFVTDEEILQWHYSLAYDVVNDPAIDYLRNQTRTP